MDVKQLTQEMKLKKIRKRNKIFLGIFLFVSVASLLMKITDEILLDLGFHEGEIHLNFWSDKEWNDRAYGLNGYTPDKGMQVMVERHPNFFWPLTQFTWITTIIIILLMLFRFFKFDQTTLPRWIKWIMTQRTLSLLAMYDTIVGVVFWASMFKGFQDAFNKDLFWFEFTITILVHSVIPVMIVTHSIIYLLRDKRASILKEMFIIKGMVYPVIYMVYYVLISVIWTDPYPITKLHQNFTGYIWLLPIAILGIYILLGAMILFHNIMLLRYNKKYDPRNDYEINMRRQFKIDKIQRRIIRKYND